MDVPPDPAETWPLWMAIGLLLLGLVIVGRELRIARSEAPQIPFAARVTEWGSDGEDYFTGCVLDRPDPRPGQAFDALQDEMVWVQGFGCAGWVDAEGRRRQTCFCRQIQPGQLEQAHRDINAYRANRAARDALAQAREPDWGACITDVCRAWKEGTAP